MIIIIITQIENSDWMGIITWFVLFNGNRIVFHISETYVGLSPFSFGPASLNDICQNLLQNLSMVLPEYSYSSNEDMDKDVNRLHICT